MIELLYPVEKVAPVIRDRSEQVSAQSAAASFPAAEMLPVVEQNGLVIGQASRPACHSGKLLHPVVHLHIVNRLGQIYLQRRSEQKKHFPLYWDSSVGGHVSYGEHMEEALFREAAEELGFYDFNPQGILSYVWEDDRERELVNVYAAVGDFKLNPDNWEVCEGRYWTPEEIGSATGQGILTPDFEYEYKMVRDNLLSLL